MNPLTFVGWVSAVVGVLILTVIGIACVYIIYLTARDFTRWVADRVFYWRLRHTKYRKRGTK